jgi:hypothetical protein
MNFGNQKPQTYEKELLICYVAFIKLFSTEGTGRRSGRYST